MSKSSITIKGENAQKEPKDLIPRSEALKAINPALNNLNRYGSIMPTREAFALLNGIISDIKSLKGE